MEPKQFFITAEMLKDKPNESHLRTSVGRSYYAAFLYFREHLKSLGLEKKRNPAREIHEFVIQCLEFSGIKEGKGLRDSFVTYGEFGRMQIIAST